jgi:hypothetical protein
MLVIMSSSQTSSSESTVRHFRTLLSPLETAEQPQWLLAATPPQKRLLAKLQQHGRQARKAAMEHFARLSTVYDYARQFDDFGIKDSKDITPADLARHSNADLVTYTDYLKPYFRLASLREAKMDAFEASLREEALIAQIQGHVQASGSSCLNQVLANLAQDKQGETPSQALLSTRHPLLHLNVLGSIAVPQILLICHDSSDDSHCVAFVPGHPQHPLKEYPNRRHFLASLQRELENAEYQAFFERFIPVRHHSAFWAGLHATSDAATGPALATAAVASGLRGWAFDKMVERITDDAWTLVRATLPDGLGSSGEMRNFSTLIQSHLMLGAGVGVSAGEEAEGRSPSDSIAPLRWVRLPDGSLERWPVDLSRYRLRGDVEAGEPDEQGLYQINGDTAICINGRFYLVEWHNALKKWRITSRTEENRYAPILEHNQHGAWHHSLEQPQHWSRLALLRRLGPMVQGFSDDQLLDFACISGVSNAQLRRVYSLDEAPPAMLRETLLRARIHASVTETLQLIKEGKPLPDGEEVPVLYSFRQLVDIRLDRGPTYSRPRRSPGDAPPTGTCSADQACNRPPEDVYQEWVSRLNAAIFNHRYELAQVNVDIAVVELQRHYPDIPLTLTRFALDRVRAEVRNALRAPGQGLLRSLSEDFDPLQEDLRMTRALEGFINPSTANWDTYRLAVGLLEYLQGWPPGTGLVLRERYLGPVQASVGPVHVDSTSVYRDEEEGWFASSAHQVLHSQDSTALGFYRSVLYALGESLSQGLGFGLNEPERLYQQLGELAMARPVRARLLLGMPVHRPWLTPVALDPAQRSDPQGGGPGLFEREPVAVRLRALHSGQGMFVLSAPFAEDFIRELLRRDEPVLERVQQLEREHHALRSLQAWVAGGADIRTRAARANAADRVRFAWESQLNLRMVQLDLTDANLDELPPVPVPLPAVEALTISEVPITTVGDGFLQRLPNLRHIDLNSPTLANLPQSLGDLAHLTHLDLSRTQVLPGTLHMLSRARHLQNLYLNDMNVNGFHWTAQDMAAVSTSPVLSTLTIERTDTSFADGVFEVLSRAPSLVALRLGESHLHLGASEVAALARMTRLRMLDLSGNTLVAAPDFSQMSDLEDLNLRNTGLTHWPVGLERLGHLAEVDLRGLFFYSVPLGAGSNAALQIREESIPEEDRVRFRSELEAAGGDFLLADHSSASSAGSESSGSGSGGPLPPAALAAQLLVGLSPQDRQQADTLRADPAAANFFAVLWRMHGRNRTRLADIQAVLRAAFSDEVRRALFEVVDEITCVDRDALMFSQMQNLAEAARIMSGIPEDSTPHEMLGFAISQWRSARLQEYVAESTGAWRRQGFDVSDPVEVELYFRRHLAERLGLRHPPTEQAFSVYTRWVTPNMLEQAARSVIAEQQNLLELYLVRQAFWQRYLRFAHARQMSLIDTWRAQVGGYLDSLASEAELPGELPEFERLQLSRVLAQVRGVPVAEALPVGLRLNSVQYTRAYEVLATLVEQAMIELSTPLLSAYQQQSGEPRPGPSWRS